MRQLYPYEYINSDQNAPFQSAPNGPYYARRSLKRIPLKLAFLLKLIVASNNLWGSVGRHRTTVTLGAQWIISVKSIGQLTGSIRWENAGELTHKFNQPKECVNVEHGMECKQQMYKGRDRWCMRSLTELNLSRLKRVPAAEKNAPHDCATLFNSYGVE